ncbi:hypothetical protein IKG49_02645 [Candidatus Saccharibacteria bacterium]|nr:hypothetical protein [Candidatus Saccharibacteria bacterium]
MTDNIAGGKNLWILTEEHPKNEVIEQILMEFAGASGYSAIVDRIRVLPILKNGLFSFIYEVTGFNCSKIKHIYIKSVSGYSSFVDFLLFHQDEEPNPKTDIPSYAIEETKTDDSESRNTGVYQRCSKFVYISKYYPNIRRIMLYNLGISQKEEPTETYIFGTRMLITIGVRIMGKVLNDKVFKPFASIDELIAFKNSMRRPPAGNVPIEIVKGQNTIFISGRLVKSGSLSHDPNIGALSIISATLRKLGWEGRIMITKHGLEQKHLKPGNKFIQIANMLHLELEGLEIPIAKNHEDYWYYDRNGEKLGTIFVHVVVESFTNGYSIYENHAGCERGYFISSSGEKITIEKYSDRDLYKMGDKTKRISIPDLVLLDFDRREIINIEGKKYENKQKGIEELGNYDDIENSYIRKYYPGYKITRTVVLYGSKEEKIIELEVCFLLNEDGKMILGIRAPQLIKDALERLIDYWR